MKKVYDWDITIGLYVQPCKKKHSITCSVHTNIQELKITTAKMLNMDVFETRMDFYGKSHVPFKPISTLFQNDVKDGDILSVRLLQTKNTPADTEIKEEKNPKGSKIKEKQADCYGLSAICTCVEPKCINYGKDITLPLGAGEFPFFKMINSFKCSVCPYRDQMKNPPMIVKEVQLSHCAWKVEGTHMFKGFPTHHASNFVRVKQKHNFHDYLRRYKWQPDLVLTVKDL